MSPAPPGPASSARGVFGADLAPRVVSGAALIAAALGVAWWGGVPFALFWVAAFAAVVWEWQRMVSPEPRRTTRTLVGWLALALAAIALTVAGSWAWSAAAILAAAAACALAGGPIAERTMAAGGMVYAGAPMLALLALRADSPPGRAAILWLYAVVWGTDIGGYFVGRMAGGPKLWPSVSPGKTWSGAVGGTLLGATAGLLFARAADDAYVLAALGLGASFSAQAGDLFESALKRRYGLKDSSALIPGHGGAMDRLDGFSAAAVFAAIVALANREGGELAAALFNW